MPSLVEALLRRERATTLTALALLTLLAWLWLLEGAGMGMAPQASLLPSPHRVTDMGAGMGAMDWSGLRFALAFAMWWVMMVAMMLPAAAPMILLFARVSGHGQTRTKPATASFLAGYLLVWGLFSLAAATAHALLERVGLLGSMTMGSTSNWLTAVLLVSAGLYQLSPVKDVCLRNCRNPAQFLSRQFRPGRSGALRLGAIHGAYCVGCCWLLMAILFVGGAMNLLWIAGLTLVVAAEKLLPWGRGFSLASGIALVLAGIVVGFP